MFNYSISIKNMYHIVLHVTLCKSKHTVLVCTKYKGLGLKGNAFDKRI